MSTATNNPFVTMGTKVTIDNTEILGIQTIGDLEGDPATVDVTTIKDTETKNLPGLKQTSAIQLTCFKDKTDTTANYEVAKAFDDKNEHEVVITFADTSTLTFKAHISVRLGGVGVGAAQLFYIGIFKTGDTTYAGKTA